MTERERFIRDLHQLMEWYGVGIRDEGLEGAFFVCDLDDDMPWSLDLSELAPEIEVER